MLNKKFGAAPGGKGTAPEGVREKPDRSASTASKPEPQASSLPADLRHARGGTSTRAGLAAELRAMTDAKMAKGVAVAAYWVNPNDDTFLAAVAATKNLHGGWPSPRRSKQCVSKTPNTGSKT